MHTHQSQQANDHSQHHHNNDSNDPTSQVLHGESWGLLIHIVHQDVLHLQPLASQGGLECLLVLEQGKNLHLNEDEIRNDRVSLQASVSASKNKYVFSAL